MNGLQSSSSAAAAPAPRLAWLALIAVWAAAATGGVIGIAALVGHTPAKPHFVRDLTAPRLGGRVVTSFGSIEPNAVERLVGPTGRTTAMHMTIPRGLHGVQVTLIVNNIRPRSLAFHRRWFRLVDATGTYQVRWASRIRLIRPLAARTILLRFAIPPAARLPRLEYRDPATGARSVIGLGSARHLVTFNPATHQHGLGG